MNVTEKKGEATAPALFTVSSSPHIRHEDDTHTIMLDVIIALLPAFISAVYNFGLRVMTLTFLTVGACMLFEALYQTLMKKRVTVSDMSAAVTGVLIAYNMPVTAPLWLPVLGAFFAIVVVKQLFGGIGKNFLNPALAARVFMLSWAGEMTAYVNPGFKPSALAISVSLPDGVSAATPLSALSNGLFPELSVKDLLVGNHAGSIGEASALLLALGGCYLLVRRIITWHIPVSYIGTVAVLTFLFSKNALPYDYMIYEILSGGLFLGAIFMATDYATSPLTAQGKLIFGVGCGLLTVFFRYFGASSEGVAFSILIMNLLVYYIDKISLPRIFGSRGTAQKPAKKADAPPAGKADA